MGSGPFPAHPTRYYDRDCVGSACAQSRGLFLGSATFYHVQSGGDAGGRWSRAMLVWIIHKRVGQEPKNRTAVRVHYSLGLVQPM